MTIVDHGELRFETAIPIFGGLRKQLTETLKFTGRCNAQFKPQLKVNLPDYTNIPKILSQLALNIRDATVDAAAQIEAAAKIGLAINAGMVADIALAAQIGVDLSVLVSTATAAAGTSARVLTYVGPASGLPGAVSGAISGANQAAASIVSATSSGALTTLFPFPFESGLHDVGSVSLGVAFPFLLSVVAIASASVAAMAAAEARFSVQVGLQFPDPDRIAAIISQWLTSLAILAANAEAAIESQLSQLPSVTIDPGLTLAAGLTAALLISLKLFLDEINLKLGGGAQFFSFTGTRDQLGPDLSRAIQRGQVAAIIFVADAPSAFAGIFPGF